MIRKEVGILDDTGDFSGQTRIDVVDIVEIEEDFDIRLLSSKTKSLSCCDFPKDYVIV